MERTELLKLGAYCVKRMSFKAQKELFSLAEKGLPFSKSVLSALRVIEGGDNFVTACGSRLDLSNFMDILTYCDQPTIDKIVKNNKLKSAFLQSKEINGHFILANCAIYYTNDMDATLRWFERILGWQGKIEARDEMGNGTYGLIEPHLKADTLGNNSPYMQLMRGEPIKAVAAFMIVWGLKNLRQRAIDNGWTKVTPIVKQPWGANLFYMTTGDGSRLRFCEPIAFGA